MHEACVFGCFFCTYIKGEAGGASVSGVVIRELGIVSLFSLLGLMVSM